MQIEWSQVSAPVRLRSVALPAEHGAWGMLGEPLLLGLLVAPSWPGLGVGLAATFGFLARHPLKVVVADRRAHRRNARTRAAERFGLAYAAAAIGGVALASTGATGWWLPLIAAAPLALVQLARDVDNRGRQLLPELLGGAALGSVVAAELMAAGWGLGPASAVWGLVALKAVGAILYVRARLRCDRGQAFRRSPVLAAHALALAAAIGLMTLHLAPALAAVAFVALLARSAFGLSESHRKLRPQAVGILEMAYGGLFILSTSVGYRGGF